MTKSTPQTAADRADGAAEYAAASNDAWEYGSPDAVHAVTLVDDVEDGYATDDESAEMAEYAAHGDPLAVAVENDIASGGQTDIREEAEPAILGDDAEGDLSESEDALLEEFIGAIMGGQESGDLSEYDSSEDPC